MEVEPGGTQKSGCSTRSLKAMSTGRLPWVNSGLAVSRKPAATPQPPPSLGLRGRDCTDPAREWKGLRFRPKGRRNLVPGSGSGPKKFPSLWATASLLRHFRTPLTSLSGAYGGDTVYYWSSVSVALREPWRVTFICVTTWVTRASSATNSWNLSSDQMVRAMSRSPGSEN